MDNVAYFKVYLHYLTFSTYKIIENIQRTDLLFSLLSIEFSNKMGIEHLLRMYSGVGQG